MATGKQNSSRLKLVQFLISQLTTLYSIHKSITHTKQTILFLFTANTNYMQNFISWSILNNGHESQIDFMMRKTETHVTIMSGFYDYSKKAFIHICVIIVNCFFYP